jgi:hypothetical protein
VIDYIYKGDGTGQDLTLMPNNFPDIGYFPEPPRGDRPMTVGNLLKLDKLFRAAEGKVGKFALCVIVSALQASEGFIRGRTFFQSGGGDCQ